MINFFDPPRRTFDVHLGAPIFTLWLVCVGSLFVPNQVYVPLFTVFIFSVVLLAFRSFTTPLNTRAATILLIGFFYIAWASVVFMLHREYSVLEQFVKLILNTSFLLASILFFELERHRSSTMLRWLERTLVLIIALSAVQVIRNVWLLGAWLWPVSGQVSNSSDAYLIATPGVFFGGAEKNIWATKIALVLCLYIAICHVRGRINWLRLSVIGLGLLCLLYTFGRTAQLTAIVAVALYALLLILRSRHRLLRYALLGFVILLAPIALQAIGDLLRFDWSLFDLSQGTQNDGFRGRLFLWLSFLNNPDDFNMFWGNGVQYGRYYFSEIAFLDNDNFHNVFLNHLVDFGVIGLGLYVLLLGAVFSAKTPLSMKLLLFLPLLACISLQYVGYDNDIMVYLAVAWLIFQNNKLDRQLPTRTSDVE